MSKIKTAATYLAIMLSCFAGFLLIGYYATPDGAFQDTDATEVFQIENQSLSDMSAIVSAEPLSMNVSSHVYDKHPVHAEKSVKKSSVLKAMSTKVSEFCSKTFPTATTTAPVQEEIAEIVTTVSVTEITEEVIIEETIIEETIVEEVVAEPQQPVATTPVENVQLTANLTPVVTETTPVFTEVTFVETTPVYEEVVEEVCEEVIEEVYYEEPVCYNPSVSDSDFVLLCNAVAHEAGSDWIDVYSKANVVEVIMNRVNSPLYPNTVYEVLTQPYQFEGSGYYVNLPYYSCEVTDSVIQAVNLYFNEPYSFMHGYFSFFGDGFQNYFS